MITDRTNVDIFQKALLGGIEVKLGDKFYKSLPWDGSPVGDVKPLEFRADDGDAIQIPANILFYSMGMKGRTEFEVIGFPA